MSAPKFIWKSIMASGKVLEGVFAINKPPNRTSAQVLRDIQTHFNPSALFAPYLSAQRALLAREPPNQRLKRRNRKKTTEVKIGHGGTLDPLATGVLIAGVGKGTKHLGSFLECTKTYEAVVLFGAATDTYDLEGNVVSRGAYGHVTREGVEEALKGYRGKIMQTPPIYSALRLNGKRLYDYARSGEALPAPIQPRPVEVLELEIVEWMDGGTHKYQLPEKEADGEERKLANQAFELLRGKRGSSPGAKRKLSPGKQDADAKLTKKVKSEEEDDNVVNNLAQDTESRASPLQSSPQPPEHLPSPVTPNVETSSSAQPPAVKLRMTVTSGFYVRSLCHDLGRAMNTFAIMGELVRTRQGDFELGRNVLEFEDLEGGEEVWGPKVERYLNDWNDGEGSRSAARDVEHASD